MKIKVIVTPKKGVLDPQGKAIQQTLSKFSNRRLRNYLMKSSVIIFPGSNCDRDMDVALKKFGFKNKMVWHNETSVPKSDLIVLPGGFSYGDYLRCGSIASKSKIINSVIEFANKGGLVIGVCNGFQILIETGLVAGALLRNKYLKFICKKFFNFSI